MTFELFELLLVSLVFLYNNAQSDKPNIIVVFLDDLGYADVGFTHTPSEIAAEPDRYWYTPNIDNLAENEGLILSNHYVHALCSPTRAGFLTGRYPWQFGFESVLQPFMELNLESIDDNIPFPKLLTNYANYETYHFGKWHVGGASSWSQSPIGYFDNWIGGLWIGRAYYGREICLSRDPTWWVNELEVSNRILNRLFRQAGDVCFYDMWEGIDIPQDPNMQGTSQQYGEELYGENILQFIQDWKDNKEENSNFNQLLGKDAFFINWQPYSPHAPIQQQVPDNVNGIADTYPECDSVTNEGRWFVCRLIQYMDRQIGQVTDKLKETGLWDNTLILFSSDNGGAPSTGERGNFGCNLPFRGRKAFSWEGGIHSASFLSGGYLPSYLQGQTYSSLIGVEDWYSIFTYIADINLSNITELNSNILDSYNMWPNIIQSNNQEMFDKREEYVNLRTIRNIVRGCVITDNGWKYLTNEINQGHYEFDGSERRDAPYFPYDESDEDMIFDLYNDPYETTNLANDPTKAELLLELKAKWQEHTSKQVIIDDQRSIEGLKRAFDTGKYGGWQDDPDYQNLDLTADQVITEYLNSL